MLDYNWVFENMQTLTIGLVLALGVFSDKQSYPSPNRPSPCVLIFR